MSFLASPPVLRSLNDLLRLDPRVVRWQTVKTGTKLQDILKGLDKTDQNEF